MCLSASRVYYIVKFKLMSLAPAVFRLLIFSVSAIVSSRILPVRKTLEESIFLASSQVCGMYLFNLLFGMYNTILTTMQRERWTAVSESPCEEPDLEWESPAYKDTEDSNSEQRTIEHSSSLAHLGTTDRSLYFRSRETLRRHIIDVHHMGFSLLVLFVAMDFGHEWVSAVFCTAVLCFQFYEEMTGLISLGFKFFSVWVFIVCVACFVFGLMFGGTVSKPLAGWDNFPVTFSIFFALLAFMGCAWTARRPVFGFRPTGGGAAVRELTIDAQHTCFIIALPLAFILYRAGVVVAPKSSLDIFLLCVLEPALRLLCVVIFIMSVCAGKTQELAMVLSVAVLIKLCDTQTMDRACIYSFVVLLGLLLLTHSGRVYYAARAADAG